MNLQKIRDHVDLALKVVSLLAIVVGGIWTYYQFRSTDADVENIQLGVSAECEKYSDSSCLLVIHIKPKNIGKVPFETTPEECSFLVTVRSLQNDAPQGPLDLEKLKEIYRIDLMKSRFSDGYIIEPGIEYDEVIVLVVPKGSMYAVKALLDVDKDDEVDQTIVVRAE